MSSVPTRLLGAHPQLSRVALVGLLALGACARTPDGTPDASHTMDSSVPLRVTDHSAPRVAHAGSGASGASWQMA